jgi:hypothetical protein
VGYALALGGVSFDRKTEPATRPTNAGKINMNVHPWTLPMVPSKRKETALAAQQHTPLTLVAETGNRFLSINEPTIAKTVPTSSAGKNDWDKIAYPKPSVLPKLRCSTRAYRNTPPIVRTAPVGKTQFHALISLSISLTPLTTELSILLRVSRSRGIMPRHKNRLRSIDLKRFRLWRSDSFAEEQE